MRIIDIPGFACREYELPTCVIKCESNGRYGTASATTSSISTIRDSKMKRGERKEECRRIHGRTCILDTISALRATRSACVAHAGGSKYPDNYVIVTRET